jgi:Spy/CpxP family protein refolding chaperone
MNNLKKYIVFCFFIAISTFASAQNNGNLETQREKIQSQKIAFISQQLALTPNEAQTFWPVYNEYDAKRFKLQKSISKTMKEINLNENLADKEMNDMANTILNTQLQLAQLDIEYHEKFKKVIPIKKVVKLYAAEKKFKNILLKKLGNQRELIDE